jgi:hypothetical protein
VSHDEHGKRKTNADPSRVSDCFVCLYPGVARKALVPGYYPLPLRGEETAH